MRKLVPAIIGIAFAGLAASSAFAATGLDSANSLNELLGHVQNQTLGESVETAQHRAAFAAASPSQRKAMMAKAQQELAQAQAAAKATSEQFSKNELEVTALVNKVADKAKALKMTGVFSIAKQTASDLVSAFHGSLLATQFTPPKGEPGRITFLDNLASQESVPTIHQLNRIWYEFQRALVAQGQVVQYKAPVVSSDGTSSVQTVLRIGPFTASSGEQFLEYLPSLKVLSVLPRELSGGFRGTLSDFLEADTAYAPAVVDPTGGVIMQMNINAPTWLQRIQLGDVVGYVIIAVGVIGLLLFLFQLVKLIGVTRSVGKQLKDLDNPVANNPLGRVLLAFTGDAHRIEEDSDIAELRITEAVIREEPSLNRFQAYLRLAVAAGPLLGLIGTVVGMIMTFQTITETGSADPRLMATGIGHAMIATVLGLGVAIPLLFANALLHSMSETVVQTLEEQSAGMLAEKIEKQHNV